MKLHTEERYKKTDALLKSYPGSITCLYFTFMAPSSREQFSVLQQMVVKYIDNGLLFSKVET